LTNASAVSTWKVRVQSTSTAPFSLKVDTGRPLMLAGGLPDDFDFFAMAMLVPPDMDYK
jgi:hypothetical protein